MVSGYFCLNVTRSTAASNWFTGEITGLTFSGIPESSVCIVQCRECHTFIGRAHWRFRTPKEGTSLSSSSTGSRLNRSLISASPSQVKAARWDGSR
jgi:hypothetical protein